MITVEFKDFDDMVAFARRVAADMDGRTEKEQPAKTERQVKPVKEKPVKEQEDVKEPEGKEEPAEETKPESPKTEEKQFTLEEVRAKLAALNKAGKRAEVKAILESFGAQKLSEIPADKFAAVMEKAGELDA